MLATIEAHPVLSQTVDTIASDKRKSSTPSLLLLELSLTFYPTSMAMNEMRLTLAKLFWNFDIALNPNSEDWWISQKSYLIWEKKPLMVSIKPRQ